MQDHFDDEDHDRFNEENPKIKRINIQRSYEESHHSLSASEFYNIEEIVIYFLIFLLLIVLFVLFVKCARVTLDPYNTSSSGTWLETLEKMKSPSFQEITLQSGRERRVQR